MPTRLLGELLVQLADLEKRVRIVAEQDDPKRAVRNLRLAEELHDTWSKLRFFPVGTLGLLAAENLWLALERCRFYLMSHDASDRIGVESLREALADAQAFADVARVIVGDESRVRR